MTDTLDPRFAANLGGAVPQNIPSTSAVHPTTPRLVPGVELSVAPGALAGPYGAAVLVTDAQTRDAVLQRASALLKGCAEALKAAAEVDDTFGSSVSLHYVPGAPGNRVIIAPTGPISRDFDDARRFFEAASAGVQRAEAAGAKSVLLVLDIKAADGEFAKAKEVAVLGALDATYVQLEARDHGIHPKIKRMGVYGGLTEKDLKVLSSMFIGTSLAKDIGEADPERATPANIVTILEGAFKKDGGVEMEVFKDETVIRKEFPLAHSVARCSYSVARHEPRIVKLTYRGASGSNRRRRLYLVGKGIVYDTGGVDIKAGGVMFGMSRDKCGAAAVAGFMKTVELLQPKDLDVVAMLSFVRNSVGSNAYVSDEIIQAHSGVYVKVGNTDAEGRMAMADPLSHLREQALEENKQGDTDVLLATVATLTGHVVRAYGTSYTALVPNAPARSKGMVKRIFDQGHVWADPFEISTLRREDFDMVKPTSKTFDVLQSNTAASSATMRGHQFPAAFLTIASGLDKHGRDSETPLPYVHLDNAGSSCGANWTATGRPVVGLTASFVLDNLA